MVAKEYKVGDIVLIRDTDWYNNNKYLLEKRLILLPKNIEKYFGKYAIIRSVKRDKLNYRPYYLLSIDCGASCWYDWMFEEPNYVCIQLCTSEYASVNTALRYCTNLSTYYRVQYSQARKDLYVGARIMVGNRVHMVTRIVDDYVYFNIGSGELSNTYNSNRQQNIPYLFPIEARENLGADALIDYYKKCSNFE